jgi:hypothetical protein
VARKFPTSLSHIILTSILTDPL